MSPRRVLALSRRIADQFRRDHRTLALLFVAPVLVTALLAWVLRDGSAPPTRLAIVSEGAPVAGRIADRLRAIDDPDVEVIADVTDVATARDRIVGDRLDVVLVLPAGLEADLAAGRRPVLRLLTAGVDPAGEAGRAASVQAVLAEAIAEGVGGPAVAGLPTLERETVFGRPGADELDALAPVFLGYFAYFFVFLLTGISFLRERLGGTLERLMATPMTRAEIVAGYTLGFGFFATLQVAVLLLFTLGRLETPAFGPLPAITVGLGVASAGSPALAFGVAVLLALGAVSLGIFVSTFARSELQVLQFIPVVIIPQGLLGGIFWPVPNLPELLQPVARALPMTYAVDALRAVMIRGDGLASEAVRLDVAVLVAIAVLFVGLAAATIRREVA